MEKSRGFITIATGIEKYHKMAYILFLSYRHTANKPCRFGIITDKRSKYTEFFDDVVVVKNATGSYMDKINMLINSPYEETIFIDADCIAYNDLNEYWRIFENATDMSAFGTCMSLGKGGWYPAEYLGKYKDMVSYGMNFHGGIYYFRKGDVISSIHKCCKDIIDNYSEYHFKTFSKPADEPVFALAMAVNQCKPIDSNSRYFMWFKLAKKVKADYFEKRLNYRTLDGDATKVMLLHFGTARTILPLYLIESKKVLFFEKKGRGYSRFENVINYASAYFESVFLCIRYVLKILNKKRNI